MKYQGWTYTILYENLKNWHTVTIFKVDDSEVAKCGYKICTGIKCGHQSIFQLDNLGDKYKWEIELGECSFLLKVNS